MIAQDQKPLRKRLRTDDPIPHDLHNFLSLYEDNTCCVCSSYSMVRYKIQVLVQGISSFFIRTVLYALERDVSVSGVVVSSVFIKYMHSAFVCFI